MPMAKQWEISQKVEVASKLGDDSLVYILHHDLPRNIKRQGEIEVCFGNPSIGRLCRNRTPLPQTTGSGVEGCLTQTNFFIAWSIP
jgi:hypothetical protein